MKKTNRNQGAPKLAEFMHAWLAECESNYMKQSTLALYRQTIDRHLIPALGDVALDALTKGMVQSFIKRQIEHGRVDGRGGLSIKTVRDQAVLLGTILNSALKKRLIFENPAALAKLPKAARRDMRVFTQSEQRLLERAVATGADSSAFGITLCLYTGLRLGELCALRWENISFERATLTVKHTLQRIQDPNANARTQIIIDAPKSQRSERTLPLSPLILHKLRQYQHSLSAEQREPKAFVFSQQKNSRTKYIEPRLFEKRFAKILMQAKIEPANFHALRHTFSTRCVELGMDIKTLSEILGHSNVSITLDLYVHSLMEQKRKEISRLDDIIIA